MKFKNNKTFINNKVITYNIKNYKIIKEIKIFIQNI